MVVDERLVAIEKRIAEGRAYVTKMPRGSIIKPKTDRAVVAPLRIETREALENLRNDIKSRRPPFSNKKEDCAFTIALLSFVPAHMFGLPALLAFGFIVVLAPWWYTAVGLSSYVLHSWLLESDSSPLVANLRFKCSKKRLLTSIDELLFYLTMCDRRLIRPEEYLYCTAQISKVKTAALFVTGRKVEISGAMFIKYGTAGG